MIHLPRYVDGSIHGRLSHYGRSLVPRNLHKGFYPRTPLGRFFRFLSDECGMAGSFTDYSEKKILDHVLGGPDFTRPTTLWMVVSTTAIADAGTGITVPGGNYADREVTNNATTWPAASGTTALKSNGVDIVFIEAATTNWGILTHGALRDALGGGNVIVHGSLTASVTVNIGETFRVKANEFDVTLD